MRSVPAMTDAAASPPGSASASATPAADAPKRRPGGQKGNRNAVTHGAYLHEGKRDRRTLRDRARRRWEAEATATMAALGLLQHPLAPRLQRRLADTETEIDRLRTYIDGKGRHDNKGGIRPAYTLYLDLQKQDRAELRALVDRLAEIAGQGSSSPDTLGAAMDKLEARERAASAAKADARASQPAAATRVDSQAPDQAATWVAQTGKEQGEK